MKTATNQTIYDIINDFAPFEAQEEYDNSGFLIGDINSEVLRVLVALDVTPEVIDEALQRQAQLLISHHPLMFHPVKSIRDDNYDGLILSKLVRSGLSLISAHTNLDVSGLSGGAVIARRLGLSNIRAGKDPVLTLGEFQEPLTARELGKMIGDLIGMRPRCYGSLDTKVSVLALAGGAYDTGFTNARAEGADALLTGEVRYHNAIAASQSGFILFDGGHYHTEAWMMDELAFYLQNRLNLLQYSVEVYASELHHGSEGYTL